MRLKPLAAALTVTAAASLAACSSGSSPNQVTALPQPPTAASVAKTLGLTGFTDCGPAPAGGVTDSGTGYRGAERVGVATFPSPDIRDGWKTTAAKLGIAPAWEGTTWVAYRAVSQTATGCG